MMSKYIFTLILAGSVSASHAQSKSVTYLFIGSYTGGQPDTGIYVYSFDSKSGSLTLRSTVDSIADPSYLALSHDGRYLYSGAGNPLSDTGDIIASRFDPVSGTLSLINRQHSGGDNPVYVAVHRNNQFVIDGHYGMGTAAAYAVDDDGSLHPMLQSIAFEGNSIIAARQEKAHIHAAVFSPACDYVFLPDLGVDKIWVCRFDTAHAQPLVPVHEYDVTTVPGSGPRHLTFHPNGRYAYCIEELSGTVAAYNYDEGKLSSIQRIFAYSKPCDFYWSADIHISPDGKFLYASNRREDENTIAVFSIDQSNGRLTLAGHQSTYGDHPRNFTIDPSGKFLLVANMRTNNIVVFRRNMKTGLLKKTKHEIHVSAPSCLQMRRYGG